MLKLSLVVDGEIFDEVDIGPDRRVAIPQTWIDIFQLEEGDPSLFGVDWSVSVDIQILGEVEDA